jgi:hypothetical protein
MLSMRTSLHKVTKADAGRSQLLIQAPQASDRLSSSKPGSAVQSTASQRLLTRSKLGAPVRVESETASAPCSGAGALSDTVRGRLTQADKTTSISSKQVPPILRNMTLLLLEALGAGLIFIGIIWWTMFSGRNKGELPDPDSAKAPDSTDPSKE